VGLQMSLDSEPQTDPLWRGMILPQPCDRLRRGSGRAMFVGVPQMGVCVSGETGKRVRMIE